VLLLQEMLETEIFQGDITQLELDALVNAANNQLWMGAGVAGAIKRAGGGSIEAEAVSKGPIPVGEAVVTAAGSLNAKYVIHAAVMGQDLTTNADKIRRATRNSLLRAAKLGIESIAFPALGTGVGGFPIEDCARIMINEVLAYPSGETSLKKVVFALFDERSYWVFRYEIEQRSKPA
jgi:O-acetyl-ADP-ribose deacetylase (regulator of RNase III)